MNNNFKTSAELKAEIDIEKFVKSIAVLSKGKPRSMVMACLLKATMNAFSEDVIPQISDNRTDSTVVYQYYINQDQPEVADGKLVYYLGEEYAVSSPGYQLEQFCYMNGEVRSITLILDLENMSGVIQSELEPQTLSEIYLWTDAGFNYVGVNLLGYVPSIVEFKKGSNWIRIFSDPLDFDFDLDQFVDRFKSNDINMRNQITREVNLINAKIAIGDCRGKFNYDAIY